MSVCIADKGQTPSGVNNAKTCTPPDHAPERLLLFIFHIIKNTQDPGKIQGMNGVSGGVLWSGAVLMALENLGFSGDNFVPGGSEQKLKVHRPTPCTKTAPSQCLPLQKSAEISKKTKREAGSDEKLDPAISSGSGKPALSGDNFRSRPAGGSPGSTPPDPICR